jgi:hypothetical protein
MTFLGPAFICALLLGAKKLMSFFGQGALLTTPASMVVLGATFALGILAGMMMLAPVTLQLYRSYRQRSGAAPGPVHVPAEVQLADDPGQLLLFAPPRAEKIFIDVRPSQPSASAMLPWPRGEISKEN